MSKGDAVPIKADEKSIFGVFGAWRGMPQNQFRPGEQHEIPFFQSRFGLVGLRRLVAGEIRIGGDATADPVL